MKPWFEGTYYKHQKGSKSLCFIVGQGEGKLFVQAISQDQVWQEPQGVRRTATGLVVDMPTIHGTLTYGEGLPLKSPIMGPFAPFSMECNHWVESMSHSLSGGLWVEGDYWDFTGGRGYIEGDKGRSFPQKYMWLQCNDFGNGAALMVAIARVPVWRWSFLGCICALCHQGREYRFATYRGVRIKQLSQQCIQLTQGALRLQLLLKPGQHHPLQAPVLGQMVGCIHESNNTAVHVRLWEEGVLVLDATSPYGSFEWQMEGL